ncbi:MAG: hypothetical protein ABIG20_03905 [archaeon]
MNFKSTSAYVWGVGIEKMQRWCTVPEFFCYYYYINKDGVFKDFKNPPKEEADKAEQEAKLFFETLANWIAKRHKEVKAVYYESELKFWRANDRIPLKISEPDEGYTQNWGYELRKIHLPKRWKH